MSYRFHVGLCGAFFQPCIDTQLWHGVAVYVYCSGCIAAEHDSRAPPKLKQDTRTDYNNGGQDKILIPQPALLLHHQRHLAEKSYVGCFRTVQMSPTASLYRQAAFYEGRISKFEDALNNEV